MKTYERQTKGAIERAEGEKAGEISGIVATGGEASDGHILNIAGVRIAGNTPMFFEHWRTLGIWNGFTKINEDDPPNASIHGIGQIKLGGEGGEKEWRNDVNYLVDEKVIGGLSIRWDAIDQPKLRTTLSKDHWAYIDGDEAKGAQEWGLYFDTSEMMENSVVTFGADKDALIERMDASQGGLRSFWNEVLSRKAESIDGAALREVLDEIARLHTRMDDFTASGGSATLRDESDRDCLVRIFGANDSILDQYDAIHEIEHDDPKPDQATEQGRAAQPDDEGADQQPPTKIVTSETLQAALLKNRELKTADNERLFGERIRNAQGRVS